MTDFVKLYLWNRKYYFCTVTLTIQLPGDDSGVRVATPAVFTLENGSQIMATVPVGSSMDEINEVQPPKSNVGPNKKGGKKPAPKKKKSKAAENDVDMEEESNDGIAIPICNQVSIPNALMNKVSAKLTMDHLSKHLIIQQYETAVAQEVCYTALAKCAGPFKAFCLQYPKATGSAQHTDHPYTMPQGDGE